MAALIDGRAHRSGCAHQSPTAMTHSMLVVSYSLLSRSSAALRTAPWPYRSHTHSTSRKRQLFWVSCRLIGLLPHATSNRTMPKL
ncbi:Os08g0125059 [Oryza sativa Japonica Group]|uniref:Os08g0125059 protein n=1 Tax=Oryza sativa subsp. japonica TaxID=39947 RepID=A0A0P0XC29_ORYSJ|nr:hypothetical protein EE612_041892 [Oryza sativa]BAT03644.1 Os08g0125059 [Oryza sativa Japonica Group]